MSKFSLLFVIILMLLSCNDNNKTKIEIFEKEFDFGTVTLKDTITYIFKIKNITDNKLIINNIATSCGCTTIGQIDTLANKNEVIEIKTQFIPKREQIDNYVTNSVVVETNTTPPFVIFRIKGKVIK